MKKYIFFLFELTALIALFMGSTVLLVHFLYAVSI